MKAGGKFDGRKLATLGAERLAEILYALAEGDPAIKRRLKLELASTAGADQVAGEIRKRLATIGRSRSQIDWHKMRAFMQDLAAQREAIVKHVAPRDPAEALDLLWLLLGLAPSLYGRCEDSHGAVGGLMGQALDDLAGVAEAARPAPAALAGTVFAALCANEYGQYDHLITLLAGPLGQEGLLLLKEKFERMAADPPKPAAGERRRIVGWSQQGMLYEDEIVLRRHDRLVRSSLAAIADALDDVDGYAALFSKEELANPMIATGIAERLLARNRAGEAMAALAKAEAEAGRRERGHWPEFGRIKIAALEALGRTEEAQALRWTLFQTSLDADHLKAYLRKLPDFDNDEAEERALAHAAAADNVHRGLAFLVAWPAPDAAAKTILARHAEIDGDFYETLTAAAELLEPRHPLAATLALRTMIGFALEKARTKRYPHAARHLETCADLATRIADFGPHPDHDAYIAALRALHGRKAGFWSA